MTVARVSARRAIGAVLVSAVMLAAPRPVSADAYRLVDTAGTAHYTNAPTDPMYRRLGLGLSTAPAERAAGESRAGPSSARSRAFVPLIREAAERYSVPEPLVHAVIRVESGFNPVAVSRKGARGLMQLMPGTASLLGVQDSFDPAENIDGGVRHLRRLIDRFGHDLELALAAYNAGEQAVTQYGGIPPYRETQGYVEKVLALYRGTSPGEGAAPVAMPQTVYRLEGSDGTPVYTNLPPGGRTSAAGAKGASHRR